MRGIEETLSRNETTEGFCMYLIKNISRMQFLQTKDTSSFYISKFFGSMAEFYERDSYTLKF